MRIWCRFYALIPSFRGYHGGVMKKLGVIEFFHEKIGGHKNNQVMTGGVTKLLNFPVIAVAVFQNFPRYARKSNNFIQHSHIFKQKK